MWIPGILLRLSVWWQMPLSSAPSPWMEVNPYKYHLKEICAVLWWSGITKKKIIGIHSTTQPLCWKDKAFISVPLGYGIGLCKDSMVSGLRESTSILPFTEILTFTFNSFASNSTSISDTPKASGGTEGIECRWFHFKVYRMLLDCTGKYWLKTLL